MTLLRIVLGSLRQHALSTAIAGASVALAGGLLMGVWVVKDQARAAFAGMTGGFDAVLGARGSKLQLVLNAVFHVEESLGNLAWADYEEIRRSPHVELAVPLAVGDNYLGYRLVGTAPEMFEKAQAAPGRPFAVRAPGRFFDPTLREAVVGSFVAERLGLKLGARFQPYHGLNFDPRHTHSERYLVVGILEPSNTPADRVIWIPLEGLQRMSGHAEESHDQVSAVLVKLKAGSANAGFQLDLLYNKKGDRLTFAWPIGRIAAQLFEKIGWFDRVLAWVAYLVALVAAGAILASISSSMNERRREIALLRALGAHRRTVFGSVVLEAAAIAALGAAAGFLVYFGIASTVAAVLRAEIGVVLSPFAAHAVMLWAPAFMVTLGALAGLVPAWKAYRTDVVSNLAPLT